MLKRIDHLEFLTVDGRIVLQLRIKKQAVGVWTGFA